jgi:hypothetical protein
MEQRAVVRFLKLKGVNPGDIGPELTSIYMGDAFCLCTVSKWHERFMQGRTELCDESRSGGLLQNDLIDAIGAMIEEFQFMSCKRLGIDFGLRKATCLRIFH